jgi:hypothetical protein
VFTVPLLRNGFFCCCVLVPFRGNLFIDLLPSSEILWLSASCHSINTGILLDTGYPNQEKKFLK